MTRAVLSLALCICALGGCTSATPPSDAGATGDSAAPPADSSTRVDLPRYTLPDDGNTPYGITVDPTRGELFVGTSSSGRIYRGPVGAETQTTLTQLCDLGATVFGTGSMAYFERNGQRSLALVSAPSFGGVGGGDGGVMLPPMGEGGFPPIPDGGFPGFGGDGGGLPTFGGSLYLASLTDSGCSLSATVAIPGIPQGVAVTPDGATAYVTVLTGTSLYAVDLATRAVRELPLGDAFPNYMSQAQGGFINAQGIAIDATGQYAIIAHLIEKRLFRLDLTALAAGVTRVETGAANFSGNGLSLEGNTLVQVAGDEQNVAYYTLSPDARTATFERTLARDELDGPVEVAVHGDRVYVVNTQSNLGTPSAMPTRPFTVTQLPLRR